MNRVICDIVDTDYPNVQEAVKQLKILSSIPEFKSILEDKNNLMDELNVVKKLSGAASYCEEDL